MAKVRVVTINAFRDFTDFVEGASKARQQLPWYRGCGDTSYTLVPTLYRDQKRKAIGELIELEERLLRWFKQKSVPYQERELCDDPWEYLFFMQHHRFPTRLLDWTESPLVGLYFALTDPPRTRQNKEERGKGAAVWVLRPDVWNEAAFEGMPYRHKIPCVGDEELRGYEPWTKAKAMKPKPLAMYGTHNTRRIAAQQGTFVVFGEDTDPMERIYGKGGFQDKGEVLVKLEIPADRVGDVLSSLTAVGITDSLVLPDLEGLAMETKRRFEFKV